jgi:serine/threonine protein kinase
MLVHDRHSLLFLVIKVIANQFQSDLAGHEGRYYVVKMFTDERQWEREVDAFKRIWNSNKYKNHHSIVSYYYSFKHNQKSCILLEYCNGGDLLHYLENEQHIPFRPEEVLQFWESFLKFVHGIMAIHSGVSHTADWGNRMVGSVSLSMSKDFPFALTFSQVS